MKKLVFIAVVLAMTMGISSTTQAFWGFSKKANKAEVRKAKSVKNENTEKITEESLSIKGESELSKLVINKEGVAFSLLAGGAKVLTNTAGTLTAEVSFGTSKVSLTIKTNADTKVYRAYDGKSALFGVAEIAVGDILSLEGILDISATSLTVTARKIKDYSAQARDANYSGVIKSITATSENSGTLVLDLTNDERDLTVIVNASTTIHRFIKKTQVESLAPVLFNTLAVGDIVKNATGVANTKTMQLIAKKIIVSERDIQTKKIKDVFATVVSVDQGNSMVVKTTSNVNYTVSLKNSSTVYNKWTISSKYSGVKKGSKTDGVTEVSTLDGLVLTANETTKDKVWVSGDLDTKTNTVVPSLIEKEFYR